MTCNRSRCSLCTSTHSARFSPYYAQGNLTYEMTHPGKQSPGPRIYYCIGCLKGLGIKIPKLARGRNGLA